MLLPKAGGADTTFVVARIGLSGQGAANPVVEGLAFGEEVLRRSGVRPGNDNLPPSEEAGVERKGAGANANECRGNNRGEAYRRFGRKQAKVGIWEPGKQAHHTDHHSRARCKSGSITNQE